jgi:hypothetical protein
MNAIVKLHSESFMSVAIGNIGRTDEDGKLRHQYVFVEGGATARFRVHARLTVINGDSETNSTISKQASVSETRLELAEQDSKVAEALKFYSEPNGYNLFKVFEIIRKDVGGEEQINKKFSITKAETSSFRGSVKRSDVWGDKARHAVDSGDPPKNTMSYEEAVAFIKDMLRKWMVSKT